MGTGQDLYKKAKTLIPGGTMLLSKRPEMFLPDYWPSYFSKAKGCTVWDLDGNKFTDVSIMGIGTNILGYGHDTVDDAVMQTVRNGNMSTFNCPEEVYLAEKLIELNPWASMVRLARSGGEANSIAIRIARAASGKDKVAICGYHGWHDWYLSANLGENSQLDGHLLPGLNVSGVPRCLQGTVLPFNYNDIETLKLLVTQNPDIGVIKMEVSRNMGPAEGYLEAVREIATKNNIVLIFDECTSGFRQTYGGLHKLYGVEPDIAMYGKAMGNGYGITAVVGRKEVMEAAQKTFISSTFWTERIGPTAALATLKVMEELKSWEIITNTGLVIEKKWNEIASQIGIPLQTSGLPALISYSINHPDWLKYKTFITQEMLGRGYLAANSVYVCIAHTDSVLTPYFNNLGEVWTVIKDCIEGKNDIDKLLIGPVCHGGFKRLN